MAEQNTDVFICGAGPVGLVLAYQLNRLGLSTYIIDAADKTSPEFPMYGRASTLYPRTLEMLDQLDLYDDMAQAGLASNQTFTYKDGKRVFGRGITILENHTGTYFNSMLNLRLKYSEDIFREKLAETGCYVHAPVRLVDFVLDENAENDFKVSVNCTNSKGESIKVNARYIVGADGGSSAVRKIADIPFPGDSKDQHWVRIDGVVKTNIPEARWGFGSFESSTHGHVLWVSLDHGATRVGYILSKQLFGKYGRNMTQEQAVFEAKLAVAPFELDFEQVHWHTVYGIQQRVAERLIDRDRIILAGDAAHTHSSGAAQGMNTGMHDVVSLGWRLAGVTQGIYKQPVLQNYSDERKAIAQQLIENDKTMSMLMSGERPKNMEDRPEDLRTLLQEFMEKNKNFGAGLGIWYPENLLNDVHGSSPAINPKPGHRAEDVLLHKLGLRNQTTRLFELTKYNGKFRVLVFAGSPNLTRAFLQSLRAQVDKHKDRFAHAVDFLTIIEGFGLAFDECLGVRKFGRAYWDADSSAHEKYGASKNLGALVVLRPDGIVGASAPLDGFEETIVPYFERLIIERSSAMPVTVIGNVDIGELINPFENNLLHSRKNAEMLA